MTQAAVGSIDRGNIDSKVQESHILRRLKNYNFNVKYEFKILCPKEIFRLKKKKSGLRLEIPVPSVWKTL